MYASLDVSRRLRSGTPHFGELPGRYERPVSKMVTGRGRAGNRRRTAASSRL
jgi:hypothetical protein